MRINPIDSSEGRSSMNTVPAGVAADGRRDTSAPSRRALVFFACAALVGAPMPAASQGSNLADLQYQGQDYAERELPRRGYTLTHSDVRDDRVVQYWWSGSRSECARVSSTDRRVSGIKTTDEHDCNQKSNGDKGISDGAKVAIAAAAILGVAALAHKSHENRHDRDKQTPQQVAEFDRGYRDGLYDQGWHNYNNSGDYSDGYQSGREKRAAETGHRPADGFHSGNAGYVNVQDLRGARGSSADSELNARGFVTKGGYKDGDRAVTIWWNRGTRQCLSMVVRDGRVKKLEPIVEGNCL